MNMVSNKTFAVICLPANIFCIEYFLQSCNKLSFPQDIFYLQIFVMEFLVSKVSEPLLWLDYYSCFVNLNKYSKIN